MDIKVESAELEARLSFSEDISDSSGIIPGIREKIDNYLKFQGYDESPFIDYYFDSDSKVTFRIKTFGKNSLIVSIHGKRLLDTGNLFIQLHGLRDYIEIGYF
ncbi:hypothetical protein GOV12_01725 [Candidatus Pacearchaeota archaeon]|nr:hypothetical protein [Candidatus Pacearchaeota archaeon]